MAENIRNNHNINGIQIGRNHEIKLSQLADDTTAFLKTEQDVPVLIHEIKRFSKVSGLNLNMLKTQGLWVGNNIARKNNICGIDFSKSTIKSLGIYFSRNMQECLRLNWDKLIGDIQNLLNSWKRRKLTLFGRVTILKTLIMSKCNYLLQTITVTKEILNKIESIMYKFLWNDKNDKIKRKQMIQQYDKGGIKMIDIKTQLETFQIKWINRLITGENATWKIIPRYYTDKYGMNLLLFKMNLGHTRNLRQVALPHFYLNMVETWRSNGGGSRDTPKTFADIRNQVIWGNKFIQHNNRCLFYKHWMNDNIIYINDLLNRNGDIDVNLILSKLTNQQNWISELQTLKKAIPNHWKISLKSANSISTKVKTQAQFTLHSVEMKRSITLSTSTLINNKLIYNYLLQKNKTRPIMEKSWEKDLNLITYAELWPSVYRSIHDINRNEVRQFRYKLVNAILPCKEKLFKWRITRNDLCEACKITENYEHLFINCPIVNELWAKVNDAFTKCHISRPMNKLQYIVTGYKPGLNKYKEINLILSFIGYAIFKAYCISENRSKNIDILFYVKLEFKKIDEDYKYKKDENTFFTKFYRYFVEE